LELALDLELELDAELELVFFDDLLLSLLWSDDERPLVEWLLLVPPPPPASPGVLLLDEHAPNIVGTRATQPATSSERRIDPLMVKAPPRESGARDEGRLVTPYANGSAEAPPAGCGPVLGQDMADDTRDDATLDPPDWDAFRATSHRMLDEMIDFLREVRTRPAWRAPTEEAKSSMTSPMPDGPTPLEALCHDFRKAILPFATGNVHPGFVGWVHGSGTPTGMLAELLAAGMNSNVGGREHAAVYVERQIISWCRTLFGFPEGASGVLVTGTSTANLIAVVVARTARLGTEVRARGLTGAPRLTAYAARSAHGCIAKAMEITGLGYDALRLLPTDSEGRLDLTTLPRAIERDRRDGFTPFLVIGTAGTVDIGAIDDLARIADVATAEGLWFHVDGAFGALAMMSPELRPRFAGIERADSLAFDFHKWAHVPYDAGCILVRDGDRHRAAFATEPPYLARYDRGAAGGRPWFADLGPDLSRSFRALKVWFTWREHGTAGLGAAMARNCRQAAALAAAIDRTPDLERLAPVALNIVCFRYRADGLAPDELDAVNRAIVVDVQESGVAVPSTTVIDGQLAIRVNLTNHRTRDADLRAMLDAVRASGRARVARLRE
jgi:glutamate/tyrosine decarboxylase-like PLP-dependent enzyme